VCSIGNMYFEEGTPPNHPSSMYPRASGYAVYRFIYVYIDIDIYVIRLSILYSFGAGG